MTDTVEITNLLHLFENAVIQIDVPETAVPPDPLKQITISRIPGMDAIHDDPILWITNGSLLLDNDLYVNGSITSTTDFGAGKKSGGGALLISHGWLGSEDEQHNVLALSPPMIKLTTTDHNTSEQIQRNSIKSGATLPSANMTDQAGQIFYHTPTGGPNILKIWNGSNWITHSSNCSGYYDTLFLLKNNGYEPANLDLGDLTAHGTIYGPVSKIRILPDNPTAPANGEIWIVGQQ